MSEPLYPAKITVEDSAGSLKVYTFGGVPRIRWNKVRDAVRALSGVKRVDGSFDEGVAMWVTFDRDVEQGPIDEQILTLIKAHLPADVPFERIAFRGYPE